MAKPKLVKFVEKICDRVMGIGRWVGARRFLFVWSAMSFGVALYIGVNDAIGLYAANYILDINIFVLTRVLDIMFMFLKIFVPMFMLVVATKYIFDCNGKNIGRSSDTFKLSIWASVMAGLLIAAFYYMDAGHIIGDNPGRICADGAVCWFSWKMLSLAGWAFLAGFICTMLTLLGLRGIYTELSFMLSKK